MTLVRNVLLSDTISGTLVRDLGLGATVGGTLVKNLALSADIAIDLQPRFHRVANAYSGATFDAATEAPRLRSFIAQGSNSGQIASFETNNPSIDSLLYKETIWVDVTNGAAGDATANPSALAFAECRTNGWMLYDGTGTTTTDEINHTGYSGYHLVDIGIQALQDRWAQNVITQSNRDGWTGVFADDLALQLYAASINPPSYTHSWWQAKIRSFLQRVQGLLVAADIKFFCNVVSGGTYTSVQQEFVGYMDGMMEEGWMRPDLNPASTLLNVSTGWDTQIAALEYAEAQGKTYQAELPATASDTTGLRYGLASFLIGAGGLATFDVFGDEPRYVNAVWFAEQTTARNLGSASAKQLLTGAAAGVWQRVFANGLVLANPTTLPKTVPLPAGSYTGSGQTSVSTVVVMGASTGLVMLKD